MKANNALLVSFKPESGGYVPFIPLNQFLKNEKDFEAILKKVTITYHVYVDSMRKMLTEIKNIRANKKPLPARFIWRLGNTIFQLVDDLQKDGFQLDGVYEHLSRDLVVKRKWLEKVIILRRYISKEDLIPETLNWGKCEKGTRKIAENIAKGILPN